MKIGCCTGTLPRWKTDVGYEYAELIQKAGYDFIDLPIAQVSLMSDGEFKEMRSYLHSLGLSVPTCNSYATKDIRLVGPDVETQKIRDSYRKVLERAGELGTKAICFGAPWTKHCPEGFSKKDAFAQLADWCSEMGEEAAQYDVILALEPISRQETNMLNNFQQVVELAQAVNHPNIKCLQDYYQMRMDGDTVDSMLTYGREYMAHNHFATYPNRGFPVNKDDDPYIKTYFQALHQIGYDGTICQEGLPVSRESFYEEAVRARSFLRQWWDETATK